MFYEGRYVVDFPLSVHYIPEELGLLVQLPGPQLSEHYALDLHPKR